MKINSFNIFLNLILLIGAVRSRLQYIHFFALPFIIVDYKVLVDQHIYATAMSMNWLNDIIIERLSSIFTERIALLSRKSTRIYARFSICDDDYLVRKSFLYESRFRNWCSRKNMKFILFLPKKLIYIQFFLFLSMW